VLTANVLLNVSFHNDTSWWLTLRLLICWCFQDGRECTTCNLRENHNFTGLMMDGGFFIPKVNLQREFVYSWNIMQPFQKHKVPHPSFDHLTVDLDQNTFGVALAVLRGGYRPRSLTVDFNRNFAWSDPGYAVLDMTDEMWLYPDACEAGCSAPPVVGEQQQG
jgi:hypothetical protein